VIACRESSWSVLRGEMELLISRLDVGLGYSGFEKIIKPRVGCSCGAEAQSNRECLLY
jgi:hypothetical protein